MSWHHPMLTVIDAAYPERLSLAQDPLGIFKICIEFQNALKGTWCSGITSASHAEGPGFKSQCVHASASSASEASYQSGCKLADPMSMAEPVMDGMLWHCREDGTDDVCA